MQKGIQQAINEGHLDLHHWAQRTVRQIRNHFYTQKVWPFGYPGPYKGYAAVNAKRKGQHNGWVSTGTAYKYIKCRVYNSAGGNSDKIDFFFKNYMQFVDMGVGRGKRYSFESRKARYNSTYDKWGKNKSQPRVQRPFFMMEINHQITALNEILIHYYNEEVHATLNLENAFKELSMLKMNI